MPEAKPYDIPKQLVWEAYQRVKANRGAAGVDGESLAAFEKDLKGNLYKIWNRMSSGSYFPPPVRLVEIPKDNGGTRPLGIPTVADRVAQTVVKMVLEPLVEPVFHPDSYGYRPGRSALDAVGVARKRCWGFDWVIDLDIKAFFDSIPHDLVERAVAHHTDLPWVRLYIGRWLRAPVQHPDGTLMAADEGHARRAGSSVRCWPISSCTMRSTSGCRGPSPPSRSSAMRTMPSSTAGAGRQAETVLEAIRDRFAQCGLELHPMKTRIVYCKDADRPGEHEHDQVRLPRLHLPTSTGEESLGQVLRELPAGDQHQGRQGDPQDHPRMADGVHPEQPAPGGPGALRQPVGAGLDELLRAVLPVEVRPGPPPPQRGPRGDGRDGSIKRFRRRERASMHWLGRIARRDPKLFVLWQLGVRPEAGG